MPTVYTQMFSYLSFFGKMLLCKKFSVVEQILFLQYAVCFNQPETGLTTSIHFNFAWPLVARVTWSYRVLNIARRTVAAMWCWWQRESAPFLFLTVPWSGYFTIYCINCIWHISHYVSPWHNAHCFSLACRHQPAEAHAAEGGGHHLWM